MSWELVNLPMLLGSADRTAMKYHTVTFRPELQKTPLGAESRT